jgi:acyl dehydratase
MASADELMYAEDFDPGKTFALGDDQLSAEEIMAFAVEWDPLPMHIDPSAAAEGPFGGLIASGAHTIVVLVRMVSTQLMRRSAVVAGRGMKEVVLRRPVRPDARLTGTAVVSDRVARDDNTALVTLKFELRDDADDLVLGMTGEVLLRRRPQASSSKSPASARRVSSQ